MVANYEKQRTVNDDLLLFLKDIGCGRLQFSLLCFWVRHPRSRPSLYTAARALDTASTNLRSAIETLVDKGILVEQHDNNGLTTYTLSDAEQVQGYIDKLGKLDCSEVISLRKRLTQETKSWLRCDDEVISMQLSNVT